MKPRASVLLVLLAAGLLPSAPAALSEPEERRLPNFEFRLLDGTVVRPRDFRGKVTVIDFWATWCQPCINEIEDYNRFYRDYGRKIRFMGLASDSGTVAEVRAAVADLKIAYPVAAPSLKELEVFGDVSILPTTWVVDRDGRIVKEFLGASPEKQQRLREAVEQLLGK